MKNTGKRVVKQTEHRGMGTRKSNPFRSITDPSLLMNRLHAVTPNKGPSVNRVPLNRKFQHRSQPLISINSIKLPPLVSSSSQSALLQDFSKFRLGSINTPAYNDLMDNKFLVPTFYPREYSLWFPHK